MQLQPKLKKMTTNNSEISTNFLVEFQEWKAFILASLMWNIIDSKVLTFDSRIWFKDFKVLYNESGKHVDCSW